MPLGLSFFLAVCLQGGSNSVHLEAQTNSVRRVLEAVSSQGPHLAASAELGEQVVFVCVDRRPLEEFKSEIADALDATWVKKPDGEYLERPPELKQKVWRAHLERRKALISEALLVSRKQVETPFDGMALANGLAGLAKEPANSNDPGTARARSLREKALSDQGPMSRLMKRLLLACDLGDLAAIPPDSRVVFSERPTRMQKAMDSVQVRSAFQDFSKEQRAWAEAATKVTLGQNDGLTVSDPRSQLQVGEEVTKTAYLEVRRGEASGLLFVNLLGESGFPGTRVLCQLTLDSPNRKFSNEVLEATPNTDSDPLVTLSEGADRFIKRVVDTLRTRAQPPLEGAVREQFLGFEDTDPLYYTVNDALATYGKVHHRDVIASLRDLDFNAVFLFPPDRPLRIGAVLSLLKSVSEKQIVEKANGWTLMKPSDRWEAELNLEPRKPIVKVLRAIDDKGELTAYDNARYAFETGSDSRMGIGGILMVAFYPALLTSLDSTDWDGLRLFGSLNENALRSLESGSQIPYGGLTKEQKRIVDRIIFSGLLTSEERIDTNSWQSKHAPVEPTKELANGISPQAYLSARVKALDVIAAFGKDPNGKLRILRSINPWTLATVESEQSNNPQTLQKYGLTGLVGYGMAQQKMYLIRIMVAPGLWKELSISIPPSAENAKPGKWDQLPQSIREEIQSGLETIRKRSNQNGGAGAPPR